jgi:HK97 family phage major capsid protein
MKGTDGFVGDMDGARNLDTGTYSLPVGSNNKYEEAIKKESLFRQVGTVFNLYKSNYRIIGRDCKDTAQFIPENGTIPIYDGMEDFTSHKIETWKLATIMKLDEDFVYDPYFKLEDYLVKKLAKAFGKGETKGFINGTGIEMPTGILHETDGAIVGNTTNALTYDEVIKLYFSVKPEYRQRAVWLMNDDTAMALRTLKDNEGNYLWRDSDDSIFGKKVFISEFMPGTGAGNKPIAFGDFSYYWVILKRPVSVRALKEKFIVNDQIGYIGVEFLDGKLIRPEAIKVIQMAGA